MNWPWIRRSQHDAMLKQQREFYDRLYTHSLFLENECRKMAAACRGAHKGIARLQRKIKRLETHD